MSLLYYRKKTNGKMDAMNDSLNMNFVRNELDLK